MLVLLLLFLLKLTVPAEQEEGGVPVMLGNTELAAGNADPYTMTEVDVMPSEAPSSAPEAAAEPEVEQPMITQQDEPSLQVKKEKPDLVLLDVMMPDISGFEVAQQMKADEEMSEIPVIFLTALNSTADIVKGFQVGGNDFISKPFNKEELIIRVTHQISLVADRKSVV